MSRNAAFEVLDRHRCLELLASVPIGRFVFTQSALPAVLPVNFVLDGDAVVFRTGFDAKLAGALDGAVVAFQVDDVDRFHRTGWSVCVTGHAELVADPAEIERLSARVHPWAPGPHDYVVRLPCDVVSGRRIAAARNAVAS